MSIVIRLSWPDSKLLPNRKNGLHWATHQSAKEAARSEGYWAAKQAIGDWKHTDAAIPLTILFCPPDKRRRDLDSMLSSCKHGLDGIAKALGVDDSQFRPILIDVTTVSKPGCVIVAVGVQIVSSVNIG